MILNLHNLKSLLLSDMSDSPRERDDDRAAHIDERPRYSSPPEDRGRSRERRRPSRSPYVDRREREREAAALGCVVYVAKLSSGTREADLKEGFGLYGEIKNIALKQRFAFITFDKAEQAAEAIRKMHGAKFVNGEELVVELSGRADFNHGEHGTHR